MANARFGSIATEPFSAGGVGEVIEFYPSAPVTRPLVPCCTSTSAPLFSSIHSMPAISKAFGPDQMCKKARCGIFPIHPMLSRKSASVTMSVIGSMGEASKPRP